MPISHFIYRCPSCGHEPMRQRRGAAHCDACAQSYLPGKGRGMILVMHGRAAVHEVPAWEVARAVDAGGLAGGAGAPDQAESRVESETVEAEVEFRQAFQETPLYRKGTLVGFVEERGPRRAGSLIINTSGLVFRGRDGMEWRSTFLDLRAIQASSSSVQVSPVSGGVITLRFLADSPRRWEDLLKSEIRSAWRSAGRGEIVEFQPRIRTQ